MGSDSWKRGKLEDICRQLHISTVDAHEVRNLMHSAIELGLKTPGGGGRGGGGRVRSSLQCFPTFITQLPKGDERGRYLALDLGGTNFRVLFVELFGSPDRPPQIQAQRYPIPAGIMSSSGEELFDHIARCMINFLGQIQLEACQVQALGFTFSFPCQQKRVDSAVLTHWTKGFQCSGVVGEDVCALLRRSLDKHGLAGITISALVNDATGCLISCALTEPRCQVGIIVGTGCNACYVERGHVEVGEDRHTLGEEPLMLINTEWGALGEQGELNFISTRWDASVGRCREALAEVLGHNQPVSAWDCYAARQICEDVTRRAGMLLAAGVAGLLQRIRDKDVVVAVDGTLIRRHPLFTTIMNKKITQLMGEGYNCQLRLSEDGSGLGAAVVAASMARNQENEPHEMSMS
eukprot:maker-scaffold308_size214241-snap-gene-1.39 protein:Tk09058 transcript:maker-scaffold308_size214241-snap-gene-1.39-mRNA-1 annotation:"hypothetical protein CAEBREN_04775"